ncbi:hypothetical protein [Streptomyces albipurpureus]|uniref:XRE family transcriptional regulator n=1 Tax=Streptomyces albipurpureus TaxID=2897419 RepID=A0ABT0V154_9ACTN|nr:hypothetical protein [Streptomyces sp. CWNU-1]MCM2393924.1 hypothetical protein [Streptomyces sp. CWNU-1]
MRKNRSDPPPITFLAEGEWPTGRLTPDAPPTAHLGQHLAQRLEQALADHSLSARAAADKARCTHPTVMRILNGTGAPDARTVLHLEIVLRTRLWPAAPHRHFPLPPEPALVPTPENGAPK